MDILEKINMLPEDPPDDKIKQTAAELEMLNFTPTLLMDLPDFLYMKKSDISDEAKRVLALKDEELPEYDPESIGNGNEFRRKHLEMLYYHYEILTRLRMDIPEAWDYIHELYEDD